MTLIEKPRVTIISRPHSSIKVSGLSDKMASKQKQTPHKAPLPLKQRGFYIFSKSPKTDRSKFSKRQRGVNIPSTASPVAKQLEFSQNLSPYKEQLPKNWTQIANASSETVNFSCKILKMSPKGASPTKHKPLLSSAAANSRMSVTQTYNALSDKEKDVVCLLANKLQLQRKYQIYSAVNKQKFYCRANIHINFFLFF